MHGRQEGATTKHTVPANIALRLVICFFAGVAFGTFQSANAEIMPHFSPAQMADMVELIVEGEWLGEDRVRVSKVLRPSDRDVTVGSVIEVVHLAQHERSIRTFGGDGVRQIEAKQVILFLNYGQESRRWHSLFTVKIKDDTVGSCGVRWFDEKTTYGYMQLMNPGPFSLADWQQSIDTVRAQVKQGVEFSKAWKQILALTDPAKKAQALGQYLLSSSAPDRGMMWGFKNRAAEQLQVCGANHAIPVLLELLDQATPQDNLNEVVRILGNFGPESKAAVPQLIALLDDEKRVYPTWVCSALAKIGDRRATQPIRTLLLRDHLQYVQAVAQASVAFNDTSAFDPIANRLPERIDSENQYYLTGIVGCLLQLNRMRGEVIVDRYLADQNVDEKLRNGFAERLKSRLR